MSTGLGHTLNQADPLLSPGDEDDCWVYAAIQAARAVGGVYFGGGAVIGPAATGPGKVSLPGVPAFRAKAGKPDVQGISNGGTSADVLKGSLGCYPQLRITMAASSWDGFVHQTKVLGWTAAVAVSSGSLPRTLQYGFKGLHEVAVQYRAGGYDIVNPLAPQGLMPQRISEASLKKAVEGFSGGRVAGVLFKPAAVVVVTPPPVVVPPPPPPPVPDPTPYSQVDLTAAQATGYNQGVADTKAAAHIVYG